MSTPDARTYLAQRIPADRLERGIAALERVQRRTADLAAGRATRVLEHDDYGYGGYYIHAMTPAMYEIAKEGWVERHLADYVLLAESPALAECCRATVIELFGVESFHVAIQHNACSDGLVQELCHGHWDKIKRIRTIGGELVYLRSTVGSYPPLGFYTSDRSSSDSPVFDALPVPWTLDHPPGRVRPGVW